MGLVIKVREQRALEPLHPLVQPNVVRHRTHRGREPAGQISSGADHVIKSPLVGANREQDVIGALQPPQRLAFDA